MCLEMKVGTHLELSEEAWVLETQRRAAEATNPVALENRCTRLTSRKSIEYCTHFGYVPEGASNAPIRINWILLGFGSC